MSTISKYWDKYKERHRAESVEKSDMNKLVSDKQAYISFLEVQLERVTQSVLTTQGFSDRIESLQTQLNSSDDKILNLTRLVKLQQTFAEGQEEDISTLKKILGAGFDPKSSQNLSNFNNIDKRVKILEDRADSPKAEKARFEDFVKEIDSALKATESKITSLVSQVTEDVESKQKRLQTYIEVTLEKYSKEFEENYQELSKKIYSRKSEDFEPKFRDLHGKIADYESKYDRFPDSDRSFNDRLGNVETGLRDLEQFLVAIAEEVKKVEEKQKESSEIEYKVTHKLNSKVQQLSELIKKGFHSKKVEKSPKTPESKLDGGFHVNQEFYVKESPKFPSVSPPASSAEIEHVRDKSKESSNSKEKSPNQSRSPKERSPNQSRPRKERSVSPKERPKSKERQKSPKERPKSMREQPKSPKEARKGRSKSPKSVTSRKSSSSKTPKSHSSSRTPKSQKSVSPTRSPNRQRNFPVSDSSKATTKSKAMEVSIKEKIQKMKLQENEEKKLQMKKDEKIRTKKTTGSRSKLDQLYQELSGKN